MTATAQVSISPMCPKCGNGMWDQKNGKFPWKPGTPTFKCKTKECASNGGVFWEDSAPANGKPPVSKKDEKKGVSYGAPGFLEGAEAEDAASLAAKIAPEKPKLLALYDQATDHVLTVTVPKYLKAGIGCSDVAVAAMVATAFIAAADERKRS
jgi:hypothetical protein